MKNKFNLTREQNVFITKRSLVNCIWKSKDSEMIGVEWCMLFSSLLFIFFFLPIFLLIYYLVPFKFKNIILLIFSLVFYAWGEPKYIFLLIFVTLLNYICGLLIDKNKNKKTRKYIMIICVIPVSYTHLTLPTTICECRSRWSPYH